MDVPQPIPFLDHYGLWPSHRKLETDGTVWSQDPPQGVRIGIEPAAKSAVFFAAEQPWEAEAALHLSTLLYEDSRYRMWYSSNKVNQVGESCHCYAESDDGFQWRRPELGLFEYGGSRRNNILCAGQTHHLGAILPTHRLLPQSATRPSRPRGATSATACRTPIWTP